MRIDWKSPGAVVAAFAVGVVALLLAFVPKWGGPWTWAMFQWLIFGFLAGVLVCAGVGVAFLVRAVRKRD